jgi:hypothetical protein
VALGEDETIVAPDVLVEADEQGVEGAEVAPDVADTTLEMHLEKALARASKDGRADPLIRFQKPSPFPLARSSKHSWRACRKAAQARSDSDAPDTSRISI